MWHQLHWGHSHKENVNGTITPLWSTEGRYVTIAYHKAHMPVTILKAHSNLGRPIAIGFTDALQSHTVFYF